MLLAWAPSKTLGGIRTCWRMQFVDSGLDAIRKGELASHWSWISFGLFICDPAPSPFNFLPLLFLNVECHYHYE